MPESNLSIQFSEIKERVGHHLGWGLGAWIGDKGKEASIATLVREGLREFYFNPRHRWSFLKPTVVLRAWPTTTSTVVTAGRQDGQFRIEAFSAIFYPTMLGKKLSLTTSANEWDIVEVRNPNREETDQSSTVVAVEPRTSEEAVVGETLTVTANGQYDLPDDFQSLDGQLTFARNEGYRGIKNTSATRILTLRMQGLATGKPNYAGVRPKPFEANTGQRFELLLQPIPDSVYSLSYPYTVQPEALLDTTSYPRGGMVHAQTILAACLAAAERHNDQAPGVWAQTFQTNLAASIRADLDTLPDTLGFSAEGGVDHDDVGRHGDSSNPFTYNGAIP